MTQTMHDATPAAPRQAQTPITIENAMLFGFKAGIGFLFVQGIVGFVAGVLWLFFFHASHHM